MHEIKHAKGQNGKYVYTCTCGEWKSKAGTHRESMRAFEKHAGLPSAVAAWEK